MNIVELVITEEDEFGVYAVSLVDKPAIEENWIALKDQNELKLQTQDEDKRLLIGAALVPNKPIYRKDQEKEWYVHFSKSTVEAIAHKFMRSYSQGQSTFMHEEELINNHVVESWIVQDEKDKSYALGLNPPMGTWMIAMHIGSKALWESQIKNGNVKGFSIEGHFTDRLMVEQAEKMKKVLEEDDAPETVDGKLNELLDDLKKVLK